MPIFTAIARFRLFDTLITQRSNIIINKPPMEKINKSIFEGLSLVPSHYRKSHPVFSLLDGCQVNEGVILKQEEWDRKTIPAAAVNSHYRTDRDGHSKKFTIRKLADGSGWAILRIE